ncbi:MAG: S8 family peptidase [Hyphomicrobiaceae bacterium]
MNRQSLSKLLRISSKPARLCFAGLAIVAATAALGLLADRLGRSGTSGHNSALDRTVDEIFGILAARAQQQGTSVSTTKQKLRDFLKKTASLPNLIKTYGHARVIVKYKRKAPKVAPPGLATRAWYQGWKFVGLPAAAPPRALGKTKFVRKDVTAGELTELRKNPDVDHVFLDFPIPPALVESGPVVRPDMSDLLALPKRPDRQTHAVVILDTGVESDHPFLEGAVLKDLAACFSTEQLRPPFESESLCPDGGEQVKQLGAAEPCDKSILNCDHGTHIAGIVAGWNGQADGKTFHGVGPEVPIIPVQIYSKITAKEICQLYSLDAPCVLSFISNQVEALEYVQELSVRGIPIGAVNVSLSAGHFVDTCDSEDSTKIVSDRVNELAQSKIPTIIAAGNDGFLTGVGTPGCIENAVTVAATTDDGNLAINFPEGGGSNYSNLVDMAAPGVNVVSSVPGKLFGTKSGTSMAAPYVAAALARVRAARPNASIADLVRVLDTFSQKSAVHPSDSSLQRPIALFTDKLITQMVAATTAAESGLLSPSASVRSARSPTVGGVVSQLAAGSNRIIVDYGAGTTAADQQRIVDLLKSRGIEVLQSQNKTSRLGIIVTKEPVASGVLESLKNETGVKGLYRDVPFPLPK